MNDISSYTDCVKGTQWRNYSLTQQNWRHTTLNRKVRVIKLIRHTKCLLITEQCLSASSTVRITVLLTLCTNDNTAMNVTRGWVRKLDKNSTKRWFQNSHYYCQSLTEHL